MSEKRLILVVEDERTISNFICRALTANDYKAMSATTGKEALSLFFSHRPDLVLLDLGLPDMDGLDVLKELSGLPQEVPVIIISARDRESEKVKALDMGAVTMWSSPSAFRSSGPASEPPCAGPTGSTSARASRRTAIRSKT